MIGVIPGVETITNSRERHKRVYQLGDRRYTYEYAEGEVEKMKESGRGWRLHVHVMMNCDFPTSRLFYWLTARTPVSA